jgi:hypothetical protein
MAINPGMLLIHGFVVWNDKNPEIGFGRVQFKGV